MNIRFKKYEEINIEEILKLYKSVGWSNYYENPNMLENAYKNCLYSIAAYEENNLVGIIRVVDDGYSIVFIQDIIVLPSYQRKGIGSKLLLLILEKYKDVYQIQLTTDNTEKTILFYESLGFHKLSDLDCLSFIKV